MLYFGTKTKCGFKSFSDSWKKNCAGWTLLGQKKEMSNSKIESIFAQGLNKKKQFTDEKSNLLGG